MPSCINLTSYTMENIQQRKVLRAQNECPPQSEVKSPANFEGRYRPCLLSNLEILCNTIENPLT